MILLGKPAIIVALIILPFYSLLSIDSALRALLWISLLNMFNSELFGTESSGLTSVRWIVLFTSALSVATRSPYLPKYLLAILLFCLGSTLISVLFGQLPALSLLKVVSFTVGIYTIITGFYNLKKLRAFYQSAVNLVFAIVLCSFISMIIFPSQSYLSGGLTDYSGLKGILRHPQLYAVFLSITFAGVIGELIQSKRITFSQLFTVLLFAVAIYLTKARTALAALGLSLVITIFIAFFRSHSIWRQTLGKYLLNPYVPIVLFLSLCLVYFQFDLIRDGFVAYMLKGGRNGDNVAESIQGSRGFLIIQQLRNINLYPWHGIGFGAPSILTNLDVIHDPFFGLPIQAEVEKGNIFLAVIEENGYIIGALAYRFLYKAGAALVARHSFTPFLVFSTAILINIGEGILFSLGGIGLFAWLAMGLFLAMGSPRSASSLSS